MREVTALAGWFGGNRMLAAAVGEELGRCRWVGIPFAGGMAELPHIKAGAILVSDLHRHVVNLARVVASDALRPALLKRLSRVAFHPDELRDAQTVCRAVHPGPPPDLELAANYFLCCWLGRASKAGIKDEFNGRPATRWNASGGGSAVRYRSALRMLATFSQTLRRCTFETMDAFEFIPRCEDTAGHGLYCDPPFPGVGRKYRHNCGENDAEEKAWHTRLRDALARFQATRVVCRFYDYPLIRELYPPGPRWEWRYLQGRTQANETSPEILIVNGAVHSHGTAGLFEGDA